LESGLKLDATTTTQLSGNHVAINMIAYLGCEEATGIIRLSRKNFATKQLWKM
jgi:hypothetical protein